MSNPQFVDDIHELFKRHVAEPDATRSAIEEMIDNHGAYQICLAMAECMMVAYCRLPQLRGKADVIPTPPPADHVVAENAALRKIISDAAAALPNGAFIHPQASVVFMEGLPKEIALVCAALKSEGSTDE